ncbi:MAG: hypothetical protein EPN23_02875 [Verrucomicrobia bacterium]|nr:MAG: hypothetical protein EPN23_02875 [Verrucomicrobiota bacterium]
MSWLSKLFGGRVNAATRILVDGSRWSDGRGGDRQSPRDQVQILQMIARFAKQEKIAALVVFEGRPLREVSEDGEYSGLKVYFTEKQGSAGDLVVSRARSAGARGLMVFTADPAVEQKVSGLGCSVMHPSTLRKAIEGGGAQGGEHGGMFGMRGGNGGGQRRRPMGGGRPPMRQQQRPAPSAEGTPAPAAPQPPAQTSNQSVRNLIDLVEEPVRPAAPPPAPAPVVEAAPAPQPSPENPPA